MKKFHAISMMLTALLAGAATAIQAEPLNYDVINLQADARTEVANDLLMATLFIEMTNTDAGKLATEINRTLNQGVRLKQEFPAVKIDTGAQSTWPVYDAKNRLAGWRTRAELRVESKNFDAASQVIAKMAGSMQLAGMNFVLSPDTAATTENQLLDTALKAFRARADIVAKALGARTWKTVNLNISSNNGGPMPMPTYRAAAMTMEMAEAVPPQEVAAGNSNLTVSVNGTIQLQP